MNDDKYQFFEFKGKCYGPGTVVKFKSCHCREIWGKERTHGKYTGCNKFYGWQNFIGGYDDKHFELGSTSFNENEQSAEDIIEKIVVPREVPYKAYKKRKYPVSDWEEPELIMWWVVYLFVMFVSEIFVWPLRLFLWAVASIVFFGCRKTFLDKYIKK